MIAIDIECSNGHLFEGWFESLGAFEDQNAKNMIICPYCNDTHIRRVISPVAVKRSTSDEKRKPVEIDYKKLAKEMVDYIQDNFEDVGHKFSSEALKMHYGVTEKRNIRGSATSEEEKTLNEEGIEFFKLPLPKKPDDDKQN
jgi:hypothetical protein